VRYGSSNKYLSREVESNGEISTAESRSVTRHSVIPMLSNLKDVS
jgi:hypothetical protein